MQSEAARAWEILGPPKRRLRSRLTAPQSGKATTNMGLLTTNACPILHAVLLVHRVTHQQTALARSMRNLCKRRRI